MNLPLWTMLAASDSTGLGLDLNVFLQYGVLGVISALLIWFAKGAYQRERDRADRGEEEARRLNELIRDRVLPVLASATTSVQESAELLRAFQRERELERLIKERIEKGGD